MKKKPPLQTSQRMTVLQYQNLKQNKKSKYGNQRSFYNGRWYDSRKESVRAYELDMLKKAGVIKGWEPQPRFDFVYNGVKIAAYVADFKVDYADGTSEIEDVKGFKTDVYRLKKKMLKAFYGIEVKEL